MDFLCKMCGGTISPEDNSGVCECEHCGSRQTYPLGYIGEYAEIYGKACELRLKTDYEGAEKLYSQLIQEVPGEPEGYWGMILCRCGAVYEDDTVSGMKLSRCSRSFGSDITSDENFINAIKNASPAQSSIYRREAAALEMLRREKIEQEGTGERYDVFICCPLTDENGGVSPESAVASEIYHQLAEEGFRIFYAPETLGDMTERETDPYVNAAIGCADVMLAVGKGAESFSAPRFMSEWGRCAAAARRESGKLLIVCVKDTDPEDLPEELESFTVKDVTKLGFLSEVIRSINSAGENGERKHSARNTPEKLIRRMNIFLADEDFDAAEEYSGLILDADPRCWQAHLGRFLAQNGCRGIGDLLMTEAVDGFAEEYAEKYGYDFSDDDIFRSQLESILGSSMKSALAYSEGEDREKLAAVYERFVSAVRDAVFMREQEEIDSEEKEELDELRRQHNEEENEKAAAKRKKQLIRSRFLGYMAVVFTVLIILAVRFHFKWAVVLIMLMIILTAAVLAGLEK